MPLAKGLAQIPWAIMAFMAASLVFASTISSADMGVTTMLSNMLSSAIGGAGSGGIILVSIAAFGLALIATNFIANSVVAAVCTAAFVPVLITAYQSGVSSLHPWSVAGVIIMMAGASYLTPPASAMVPFILGPHVDIKAGFKISSLLIACTFVIAMALVFFVGY
jgi:hypothetical protein